MYKTISQYKPKIDFSTGVALNQPEMEKLQESISSINRPESNRHPSCIIWCKTMGVKMLNWKGIRKSKLSFVAFACVTIRKGHYNIDTSVVSDMECWSLSSVTYIHELLRFLGANERDRSTADLQWKSSTWPACHSPAWLSARESAIIWKCELRQELQISREDNERLPRANEIVDHKVAESQHHIPDLAPPSDFNISSADASTCAKTKHRLRESDNLASLTEFHVPPACWITFTNEKHHTAAIASAAQLEFPLM
jgi:hypothetical protein